MAFGFWSIFRRIFSINWTGDFAYALFVICVGSVLIIEFARRLAN